MSFKQYKYDISCKNKIIYNKEVAFFINHKTAIIYWEKFHRKFGLCNLLTFDYHNDARQLVELEHKNIFDWDSYLRSNFTPNKNLPHFSEDEEFTNWDISNQDENFRLMQEKKIYFTMLSDNTITVAFMKNIIKDTYWFHNDSPHHRKIDKCDDINGDIHNFHPIDISNPDRLQYPDEDFILDIDLDFFTKKKGEDALLIKEQNIVKYIEIINELFISEKCKGVTIALEPGCSGSIKNCSTIIQLFSKHSDIDIKKEVDEIFTKIEEEYDLEDICVKIF